MKNIPDNITKISDALHDAGGHCYVVGGFVRDSILGVGSKDIDIEIHNLSQEKVEEVLSSFGGVDIVGKSFGVYNLHGMDVDWSLPRTEKSTGDGHDDFEVSVAPFLGITKALRRRDFTINAMAYSLKDGRIVDPFNGREDIYFRNLVHVDKETFVEDPLRVLRGAQFCARFLLTPSFATIDLCSLMVDTFKSLPRERVLGEMQKLLLKGKRPSLGINFLRMTGWLVHFPELEILFSTPQDPRHHPEGSVGIHTMQVIDRAADLRDDLMGQTKLIYMLACLLHDVGKPATTVIHDDGSITSHAHESEGVDVARTFLSRLTNEESLIEDVCALVKDHMFPHYCDKAKASSFRRLQKRVDPLLLLRVAKADGDSKSSSLDHYYKSIMTLGTSSPKTNRQTVVHGRDLIARGMTPGPEFGRIIAACEEIYLETGETDVTTLLNQVLDSAQ